MADELFIQIRDGQPHEHPIFKDNFLEAFPHVDIDNLPPEFARFVRVERPTCTLLEVIEGPTYEWVDGVVKDVWVVRAMTSEEEVEQRALLTTRRLMEVEQFKEFAQFKADTAETDSGKQKWLDYLAACNAWVLVDPVEPNFPELPKYADKVLIYQSPTF